MESVTLVRNIFCPLRGDGSFDQGGGSGEVSHVTI